MSDSTRQITFRGLLLGALLSVVLAAANAYLGLFAGLTVSASIPAAVVSMAILRWFRNSGPLENNIVQTAASAGEAVAAGAIFTLPALVLMGYWVDFHNGWTMLICGVGGLLGVLLTIPLRHALIDQQKLPFPEGNATAAVLQAGHADKAGGAKLLIWAALFAALLKLGASGLKLWQSVAHSAVGIGKGSAYLGINMAPALFAVGAIVGTNVALLVFSGGLFTWCVALPVYTHFFHPIEAVPGEALAVWSAELRHMGVGAMAVGGLWALWGMRSALVGGIKAATDRAKGEDLHPLILLGLSLLLAIVIAVLYRQLLPGVAITLGVTVVALLAAFVFSAVAAYMAGVVGSSNNPISGVTIATLLATSLGLWLAGLDSATGPVAALMVGAVVCCAAAIGGDSMQDLKAGKILGATPWKQQVAQMLGVISAVFVLAPVMSLLLHAYGLGLPSEEQPSPLPAPQASLMAAVATGVFSGDLPWMMVGIGALVGVFVILLDEYLRRTGASFRAPVLAVAVGIYLPLKYSTPIALGGLLVWWLGQAKGVKGNSLLLAAGLITGEALMGILIALPLVWGVKLDLGLYESVPPAWPALIGLLVCMGWMWRLSRHRSAS